MKLRLVLALAVGLVTIAHAALLPPLADTDQGRRASAYLEAFNSGRDDAVRAFLEANVSKSALAERPIEERLAGLKGLREDRGHLTPQRVLEATDDLLRVEARDDHGALVELSFVFEPEKPHQLMGMRVLDSIGGPGPAPAVTPLPDGEAIQAWSGYLDSLSRADAFSGAVLVTKGDSVLFRSAYGMQSREERAPNRTDTRFNLGSINKIFTKLAIAQLVEQGKVSLDATIDRYLPEYPKAVASRVTVRQLLEHRGGIGDIFGDAYDHTDRSKLRRVSDWIPLFRDRPLAFEPGSREQYSNGGYVLLGAIVEHASGEDYYDYMRRHIYRPLGLTHTDSYSQDERVPNLAMGYTRRDRSGGAGDWRDNRDSRPMRGSPAGGGYSTVDDLLLFTRALRSGSLVHPENAKDFRELAPGRGAGLGAMFGGGAPGINAAIGLEGPYTIIVLSNLDPPTAEQAASRLRAWLPLAPKSGRRIIHGGPSGSLAPDAGDGHETWGGAAPGEDAQRVSGRDVGDSPRTSSIPSAGVSVEMLRTNHLPVVMVMVNGKGPFRFGIDTGGAGSLRLDSTLVARLGLPTVGQVRGGDPSGRNGRWMNLVSVQSVEIGGARFEGMTAAVRDYNERRRGDSIDGILGFGLFADCLFTLDYPGNRVKLERGELPPADGRDVLAFDLRHGIPNVKLQVDSLTMDADVDAGSMGGFSLPASLAAKLPLASAPRVVGRARTVSNEFEIEAAELRGTVRLGRHEFAGATVTFQPVFPTANVGSQVLRDFAVTFDQKHRRMRLVRGGA